MYKLINKKHFIKISSMIIIVIYLVFLYIDFVSKSLENIYSVKLKYSTIVLCFIISLLIGAHGYRKEDKLLVQLARLFTLIADYFLVISSNFTMGIFFFSLVQITYIIRHSIMENEKYKNLMFFILSLIIALITLLKIKIPSIEKNLIVLALIYASLLITSLYCAVSTISRGKYSKNSSWIIALGMFLFFMCDLNVGLYNIVAEGNVKFFLGFLIWIFYLPSQLLLTLSGFKLD
ncbi:lysoplasmalogenase family protein [Clostridium sp.]|uniref:lysoplasmalogenase family protein n=1 Tax=Clostridium sp. TaxID=1506 RepID=UPI0032176C48